MQSGGGCGIVAVMDYTQVLKYCLPNKNHFRKSNLKRKRPHAVHAAKYMMRWERELIEYLKSHKIEYQYKVFSHIRVMDFYLPALKTYINRDKGTQADKVAQAWQEHCNSTRGHKVITLPAEITPPAALAHIKQALESSTGAVPVRASA